VMPHEPLKALYKKVDRACIRAGLAPEGRAYHPHITLGRLKRGSGSVAGMAETHAGLSGPPFPVDSFALFETTLTPEGAVYTTIERYRLAGL